MSEYALRHKECIIDANCLALYLLGKYCEDPTKSVSPENASEYFRKLVPKLYSQLSLEDFVQFFNNFHSFKTTPLIIHESAHIFERQLHTKKLAHDIMRSGALIFKKKFKRF